MDRVRCCFWLICWFLPFGVYAQDVTNFTQYFINPYSINPSYAGIEGRSALFLTYRKQWANIDGGPTIGNLSFHAPLVGGLNFGLNVTNDTRGILNTYGAMLTAGYTVAFDRDKFIRFGISAGVASNGINLDEVDPNDPILSDPVFAEYLDNNMSLLGNVGLSIHLKSFHIGAAMPNIFSPSFVSPDAFNVTEIEPFQSIIVHASNRFYFANDKHIFEPYVIYRINDGLPSQYEAAAVLHLNHVLWLGGAYKQDFGISALGGIKLQNFFLIGGSYSIANTGINELNSPSYEIQLSYIFGAKKDKPVYSFVNSVKEKVKPPRKSAAEIARQQQEEQRKKREAEALAQKQQEEAAALAKQQEEQRKQAEADALAKQQEEQRKQAEADALAKQQEQERISNQQQQTTQTNPPVEQNNQTVQQTTTPPQERQVRHDGGPRLKSEMLSLDRPAAYDTAHHETQARLSRLEEHADDPDEHHGLEDIEHANAERHEFVRQGEHRDELDLGDYVIAGVFKSTDHAVHFSEGLVKLGFNADYGHLTEKNLWYVYIAQSNDINVARTERDKYRKMKLFRDAWLLTVHE